MATVVRALDRGTRQAKRWLDLVAKEFREARLTLGLSQRAVAASVRISRAAYGRIERAELRTLSFTLAARIAAVLGLDLYVALYPGPRALRDEGQVRMIRQVAGAAAPPLRSRTDVPLPRQTESPEWRAWDLQLTGNRERTVMEFESRLHDAQAQVRRINLKRRDDPSHHFLLVIADSRHNRRVVAEYPDLLADLPCHKTATVLHALRSGQHPPTGYVLLDSRPPRRAPPDDADTAQK